KCPGRLAGIRPPSARLGSASGFAARSWPAVRAVVHPVVGGGAYGEQMPLPGPAALGRGVVITRGGAIPAPWITAPVVTIDETVLRDPAAVVTRLHDLWAAREPVVVELDVDPGR